MLDKQLINLSLMQGIDTKTNPKLMQGKLLQLVNMEMNNGELIKTQGYISLATATTSGSDPQSPKKLFQLNDTVLSLDNNTLYTYDAVTDSMAFNQPLTALGRTEYPIQSNIYSFPFVPANTLNQPFDSTLCVASGSYGDFIVTGFHDQTRNNLMTICSYNATLGIRYPNIILGNPNVFQYYLIQDIVCAPDNFFVYATLTSGNYFTATAILVEFKCDYTDATFTATTVNTSIANLGNFEIVVNNYYKKSASFYLNGSLFVTYDTYVAGSGNLSVNQNMIVRDLNGNTTQTFLNIHTLDISLIDPTERIANSSIGVNGVQIQLIPGGPRTECVCVYGAQNIFVVYLVSPSGVATRILADKTQFGMLNNGLYTASVGSIYNKNQLCFVTHGFNESYTSALKLPPTVSFFNTLTAAWTYNDGRGFDTRFTYPNSGAMLGEAFLGSSVFYNDNNCYFCLYYFPYIGSAASNTQPNMVTATPVSERKCTIVVVDAYLNVVDRLVDYVAALNNQNINGVDQASYPVFFPRTSTDSANGYMVFPFYTESSLSLVSGNIQFSYQLSVFKLQTTVNNSLRIWPSGQSQYINTSLLNEYSNGYLSENNFHDYPQLSTFLVTGQPSGNLIAGGTYGYSAIFEWTNAAGEIVRSQPAIQKSVTVPAGGNAYGIVYITHPPYFSKRYRQRLKIYRTLRNGNTYYLIGTVAQAWANETIYPQVNYYPWLGTSYFYTFVDTYFDNPNNEILYTSGNVLGAFPFPSSYAFTLHNNRIFSVIQNNRISIQYSKQKQLGVSLEAHPALVLNIEPRGGDILELASLDDKLIIFKRDYIYCIQGDGADNTGSNSTFTTPYLVNSPVGCSEPGSVVRMPNGIMFKSTKGIYLLNRNLQVSYIGADVEAYNSDTITSATLLFNKNKVKFTTMQGDILTFDYYYNLWSTENNIPAYGSALVQGNYTVVRTDGEIWKNDANTFTRNGANYQMYLKTGWLKLTGIQNFNRAYKFLFLGTYKGTPGIVLSVAYDYNDTITDTTNFDTSSFVPSIGAPYQFRSFFTRQKCEAVQIILQDSPTATANTFSLTDLTIEAGVKRGVFKFPTAQSTSV